MARTNRSFDLLSHIAKLEPLPHFALSSTFVEPQAPQCPRYQAVAPRLSPQAGHILPQPRCIDWRGTGRWNQHPLCCKWWEKTTEPQHKPCSSRRGQPRTCRQALCRDVGRHGTQRGRNSSLSPKTATRQAPRAGNTQNNL